MKNLTTVKIPKKYAIGLEGIDKDFDGYWGYTKKGYMFTNTDSHTAHGLTQKEFMEDIRTMVTCDCKECKN